MPECLDAVLDIFEFYNKEFKFNNKNIIVSNFVGTNLGYSPYAYDIGAATIGNVIYTSLDPSIFEVKYPNQDIQGRVVNL